MTKVEAENWRLEWKWGNKLDKAVRHTKCIIRDAFDNYIKSKDFYPDKKSNLPEDKQMILWEKCLYKEFKETVLDNSFIGHFIYTDKNTNEDFVIDFISESEGTLNKDELGCDYYGFKIWNKRWSMENNRPVYIRFVPSKLKLGFDSNWETNSSIVHPEVANYIYKNVFPMIITEIKPIMKNLQNRIHDFELSTSAWDFKVGK